jgi:hypothetical protein
MAIGPRGGRSRLTGSEGQVLRACGQEFSLELKQTGFDRSGPAKSPQEACQPMSERKLEHGSRVNAADEGALERSVGPNIFESFDDGLISESVTPSAAA